MPTSDSITAVLTQLSQDWTLLAIFWHGYVLAFAGALALEWRPTRRNACLIVMLPLLSAITMSGLSGNPFTTVLLGGVFVAAMFPALRAPREAVSLASAPLLLAGAMLTMFGLVYPHFLGSLSLATYLYAAPVGIVPCPTLAVIVGLSLVLRSFGSRSWALIVGVPALFYGVFGALYLGVAIDWVLSAGAVVLIFSVMRTAPGPSHAS